MLEERGALAAFMDPRELGSAYVRAFNAREIEPIMALYEEDAVLVPLPGQRASGRAAIREAQLFSLSLGGQMHMVLNYCICSGDVALMQHVWIWSDVMLEGELRTLRGRTAEVAHRREDGSWRYAVDHVWQDDDRDWRE